MLIKDVKTPVSGWMRRNWLFLITFFVLAVVANLFLFQFYGQEKYIYFWDYSGYELSFTLIVHVFSHNGLLAAIGTLLDSIAISDHSFIAPFIISPVGLLFGTSRPVYLFSVLNVLALPAVLAIGWLFMLLTDERNANRWYYALIPITITWLTPQFWVPITSGYYDVSTLIVANLIWGITGSDWKRNPTSKAILVGMLLTMSIFVRRWFGYWVFSFFPAVIIIWAIAKWKQSTPLLTLKNIFICGISASLFFAFTSSPVMYSMIRNDYSVMFQAYKLGNSTLQVMLKAVSYYGWLSIAFAVVGLILALKYNPKKQFICFIAIQTFLTLLLFSHVQLVGAQHHYQFMLAIILFQALFLFYLWRSRLRNCWKYVITSVFCVITLINFVQSLIPQFTHFHLQSTHMLAEAEHYPLVRNDIPQIESLMRFLDQYSDIYVVAASMTLNDDMLRESCHYIPVALLVCSRIMQSSVVDLRDGFPQQFLSANYVLVGDPIQYHLQPKDERVIGILADEILNKNNIGNAFEIIPRQFTLDNGVQVKIYKKVRDFTPQELQKLENIFLSFYPSQRALFRIAI